MQTASSFDLVVVGGGLAGSSLAVTLAREGVDVLVVERERVFRDRVRGEVMAAWGTVEAKQLGLYELLRERCAIDVAYLTYHVEGEGAPIDLLAAAPHFEPSLVFHHPVMQEALIEEAAMSGATVWRPSRLVSLTPGDPPAAEIEVGGVVQTVTARLIVGADGRESQVARLGGFERRADPDELLAAGLLVQGEMDTGTRSTSSSAKPPGRSPLLLGSHPASAGSTSSITLKRFPAVSRVTAISRLLLGTCATRACRVSGWSMRNRMGRSPRSTVPIGGSNGRIGTASSSSVTLRARATHLGEAVSRAHCATSACYGTR